MVLEILGYGFMQKALLAGSIVAIACSLLGVFLILRRMALIGDGLSHIAFGGVAFGLFVGFMPFILALLFSVTAAIGIVKLRDYSKTYGDVALGIVFSTALALGVILISMAHGFTVDLHYFLFGNIISVSEEDVQMAFALGALIVGLLLFFNKELMYIAFDEISAMVANVPVNKLNLLTLVLTAIVVVISIRIVGILLISSFLIIPPAAALQVARSFKQSLILSALFGLLSTWIGLFVSYFFDIASGGSIVMVSVGIFLSCVVYNKIKKK